MTLWGGADYSAPPPYAMQGCRHWRQPVRVGRRSVTCSAALAATLDLGPRPQYGIYLAERWQALLGPSWTNGSRVNALAAARPYPALIWDWPDLAALPPAELDQLMGIVHAKLRHGVALDIGCAMGHGRTGTLLACLLVRYERLPGQDAIRAVRARYCRHAIESPEQEKAIIQYAARRYQ